MNTQDLVPWLNVVADLAGQASTKIPGPGGIIAGVAAVAFRFAADLAKQGVDPLAHIERIHAADAELASIEESWAQKLRDKFEAARADRSLPPA